MGTEVLSTGSRESNLLPHEYYLKDTGSIVCEGFGILETRSCISKHTKMASTHMEASNKLFAHDWWRDYKERRAEKWLGHKRRLTREANKRRLTRKTNKRRLTREAKKRRLTREAKKRRSTREAITRRSTLNQIEFGKRIRELLKKRHAIHKEANKPLSTSLLAEICKEILKTLLENNTVSRNTVQRLFCDEYEWNPPVQSEKHKMHKALAERSYPPSPGAPFDDGNHAPASTQMPMKLPSNDPASVGASIDDVPNHIENPGHEPSSSTEASPAHAPDIITSSDGACDDGNRAPPSKQMAMAIPSNDPASVGASIDDDPNHIENPGDEPSSSMEASAAHAPDITSSSNGACDDGNPAPPSTQMPVALPSNDPAPVGGSSDDDPNGIGNPSDESSRSTEASPAQAPDITTSSSNGASPPVREDDSERREPPAPHDIENQRDGNGDLEAIPKQVLLTFALQAFQILSNVKSNDNNLLSRKAEILQYCAEALTVIGFFCGLGVILLRNQRGATNIMSSIGFYVTGLGFIATLCVPLGKFMFWILGFIGFLFSALYAYALGKGWIV